MTTRVSLSQGSATKEENQELLCLPSYPVGHMQGPILLTLLCYRSYKKTKAVIKKYI